MAQLIPPSERTDCPVCGRWTCGSCGWKSAPYSNKTKRGGFYCMMCGSSEGTWLPTRHRKRWLVEAHDAK